VRGALHGRARACALHRDLLLLPAGGKALLAPSSERTPWALWKRRLSRPPEPRQSRAAQGIQGILPRRKRKVGLHRMIDTRQAWSGLPSSAGQNEPFPEPSAPGVSPVRTTPAAQASSSSLGRWQPFRWLVEIHKAQVRVPTTPDPEPGPQLLTPFGVLDGPRNTPRDQHRHTHLPYGTTCPVCIRQGSVRKGRRPDPAYERNPHDLRLFEVNRARGNWRLLLGGGKLERVLVLDDLRQALDQFLGPIYGDHTTPGSSSVATPVAPVIVTAPPTSSTPTRFGRGLPRSVVSWAGQVAIEAAKHIFHTPHLRRDLRDICGTGLPVHLRLPRDHRVGRAVLSLIWRMGPGLHHLLGAPGTNMSRRNSSALLAQDDLSSRLDHGPGREPPRPQRPLWRRVPDCGPRHLTAVGGRGDTPIQHSQKDSGSPDTPTPSYLHLGHRISGAH
jgi:hypothetical protein